MRIKYFLVLAFLLSSITLFSQYQKARFDTINCSTLGCENLGHLQSISCSYLSLYLENKTEELDRVIWSSIIPCTTEKLICKYYKQLGELPNIGPQRYYINSKLEELDTIKKEGVITYKIFAGWSGSQWINYKIMIDKPDTESYKHFIIGSGSCNIMLKLDYITTYQENTVQCLGVSIYSKHDPVGLAKRIIDEYDNTVKDNFEKKKAFAYGLLETTTEGWSKDKIQGELNSIRWSYSDSRTEGMCEEDYFGTSRNNFFFSIGEYAVEGIGKLPEKLEKRIQEDNDPAGESEEVAIVDDSVTEEIIVEGEVPVIEVLQGLGKVTITANQEELNIPGLAEINIKAFNDRGLELTTPYLVKLKLGEKESFPFVEILNDSGYTDKAGNFKGVVKLKKPLSKDIDSIIEKPFEIAVNVVLLNPLTKNTVYKSSIKLPLAVKLLWGTVNGPTYEPRKESLPPELYPSQYQIINSTDNNGNFYILVNSDLISQKSSSENIAEQTDSIIQSKIHIQWPENGIFPLVYLLDENEINQNTESTKIRLGLNGMIDLLSVSEHENRAKDIVLDFVDNMPLLADDKSNLFKTIQNLKFRYNVNNVKAPTFTSCPETSFTIDIPEAPEVFWNLADRNNDNAYSLVFHAIGHFVNRMLCFSGKPYFNILNSQCSGSNFLFEKRENSKNSMVDVSEYIAFYEAGADFFCYLLYQFLQNQNHDFTKKSLYYDPGYSRLFEKDQGSFEQSSIDVISGMQTSFLLKLYGFESTRSPEKVYADFIEIQKKYVGISGSIMPAQNLHEWILARKQLVKATYATGFENVENSLLNSVFEDRILIYPTGDPEKSGINIDNIIIPDLKQVPGLYVSSKASLKALKGTFTLLVPDNASYNRIWMLPEAKVKVEEIDSIRFIIGNFYGKGTFMVHTSLAMLQANDAEFRINLEVDNTTLDVLKGEVSLTSSVSDEVVGAYQTISMNKKGRMRKPKEMDEKEAENLKTFFGKNPD